MTDYSYRTAVDPPFSTLLEDDEEQGLPFEAAVRTTQRQESERANAANPVFDHRFVDGARQENDTSFPPLVIEEDSEEETNQRQR